MGRRSRTRSRTIPVDHVARVRAPDAVWDEFRRTLGPRSIAHAVGEFVARDVERQRAARVRRGTATDRELLAALDDARHLRDELAQIVRLLESRAASPAVSCTQEEW